MTLLSFRDRVKTLLELGQTQRWHTEIGNTVKTQDVAQHVYNIMWLVYVLTEGHPSSDLLLAAMMHDSGERFSGDVPSPAKRKMGLGDIFDKYEESKLREELGVELPKLYEQDAQVLKMADVLDGCFFCMREAELGNRRIRKCYFNFLVYLWKTFETTSDIQASLTQMITEDYEQYFGPFPIPSRNNGG